VIVLERGKPYPLGATCVSGGVNVAIFSAHAEQIELCVFDAEGQRELSRHPLFGPDDQIWHGFLPDAQNGLIYGFRAHGRYEPDAGHRFNANKLLLDPYARAWHGQLSWHDAVYGYQRGHPDGHRSFDERDSAPHVPKSVVQASSEQSQRRALSVLRPLSDVVVMEAHLKGLTQQFPSLPDDVRGCYSAVEHSKVLDYLSDLGITAVEWLPLHAGIDDDFLAEKKLTNYWGYNTLGFFAPSGRFAQHDARTECQDMIKALHSRNIECWLDVVFNHTAEGDETGPTLCFRGLDNASYYQLSDDKRAYLNHSGCGNILNVFHPRVLQLVADSLRFWVSEFGIDGFRFDLASILGRNPNDFDAQGAFFKTLKQDPQLQGVRLIAEPWDIGPGGYQLGAYPSDWSEWNDQYRDGIRKFWLGEPGTLAPLADLLLGSAKLFGGGSRTASTSVNFVTAHDGFTLHDLVSYSKKHNAANLENNRDGHNANYSCNHGVEGDTNDASVLAAREQHQRNVLATLLLSQGVPMILAGDEVQNSQQGNNNAYCQDSAIGWIDWPNDPMMDEHRQFVRQLINLRQRFPVLRQATWLHGAERDAFWNLPDVSWLNEAAQLMTTEDWADQQRKTILLQLVDQHCADGCAEALLIALNNSTSAITIPLSTSATATGSWRECLNTSKPTAANHALNFDVEFTLEPKSVSVLHCYNGAQLRSTKS